MISPLYTTRNLLPGSQQQSTGVLSHGQYFRSPTFRQTRDALHKGQKSKPRLKCVKNRRSAIVVKLHIVWVVPELRHKVRIELDSPQLLGRPTVFALSASSGVFRSLFQPLNMRNPTFNRFQFKFPPSGIVQQEYILIRRVLFGYADN